jgi:hypothetical protein
VPEGVDADRLAEAELRDDLPHRPLHAAGGHRAVAVAALTRPRPRAGNKSRG